MNRSNQWVRRTAAGVMLAAVLLVGPGCLFGGHSKVRREGNYVSQTTLSQIEPGKTTMAWVRGVMGEPTQKIDTDPGRVLWKYAYTETKDSSGYVFLIFDGRDQKVTAGSVFVEFDKGVVTRTWRG